MLQLVFYGRLLSDSFLYYSNKKTGEEPFSLLSCPRWNLRDIINAACLSYSKQSDRPTSGRLPSALSPFQKPVINFLVRRDTEREGSAVFERCFICISIHNYLMTNQIWFIATKCRNKLSESCISIRIPLKHAPP